MITREIVAEFTKNPDSMLIGLSQHTSLLEDL